MKGNIYKETKFPKEYQEELVKNTDELINIINNKIGDVFYDR